MRQVEPRILTIPEFQRLLAEVHQEWLRLMLIAAFCLGLRISELAALKWGGFDWEGLRVYIRRGIYKSHIGDVKTKYSGKPMAP
ncbi:MAG TPA: hypothetical protein VEB03_00940 [Candidatus Nanoarchaeia archaeon]|nr:hypothetical protein [Candidatus Nanoarchaeia archaeon]